MLLTCARVKPVVTFSFTLSLNSRPGSERGAISAYPNEETLLEYANDRLLLASGTASCLLGTAYLTATVRHSTTRPHILLLPLLLQPKPVACRASWSWAHLAAAVPAPAISRHVLVYPSKAKRQKACKGNTSYLPRQLLVLVSPSEPLTPVLLLSRFPAPDPNVYCLLSTFACLVLSFRTLFPLSSRLMKPTAVLT